MTGRRTKAKSARRLGIVATVGLLVPFAPTAATTAHAMPAMATCRSALLPVPAGTTESSVNGGDPTGRYLVGVGFHVGGAEGLLWVDGQPTPVDQSPLSPYNQVQFNAVDNHGTIVGDRTTDNGFQTDAFIYRDGRFTILPAPNPGDSAEALAINSAGDVVGTAFGATGPQPVEWPAGRAGTVRVLPTPGDVGGFAAGVDQDGTVVGYLAPWPPGTPYVWPAHRAAYPLPVPTGSMGGNAVAIRLGLVAGNVFDPASGETVPAMWNLRSGQLTVRSDVQGAALSINRWGTIGVAGGALVHADGRVVPVVGWVNVVTDRGTAAGTTNFFTGQAVLWTGC